MIERNKNGGRSAGGSIARGAEDADARPSWRSRESQERTDSLLPFRNCGR